MGSRRQAREKALQILYAHEMTGSEISEILDDLCKPGEPYRNFIRALAKQTVAIKAELDDWISQKVEKWALNRLAIIDRILIRVALCEILYFADIPPKVSINEAIDIAKRFSTEKSGAFINGILDAVYKDLLTNKEQNKSSIRPAASNPTGE
ncbi:MAG: transcription antitermination factor NusB [Candidatus Marinimicrobia bacterium]|nr:transcription antitermination factor NusB [Candidatus Neomarinimicrobiota bacterium]